MFLFFLAGHLGMTVAELGTRMSVSELREWMAVHRFIEPLPRPWRQTGILAALSIAPHIKGKPPKPEDFIPINRPPMTAVEIAAELSKLRPPNG
jgi:hypothetical protein